MVVIDNEERFPSRQTEESGRVMRYKLPPCATANATRFVAATLRGS